MIFENNWKKSICRISKKYDQSFQSNHFVQNKPIADN